MPPMIPDSLWETLLRDLPTTAILIAGLVAVAKYLDRWLTKFAEQSEGAAQERQGQILVLLEKVLTANAETDKRLSAVIDRNTLAMDRINETTQKSSNALAALVQADGQQAAQMRQLTTSLIEHYRDVASRPCQQAAPTRKRPQMPKVDDE